MSILGMDDDLLYGPANTGLLDWTPGMLSEEPNQHPVPCPTTLTDKQEIELLRDQVRALKEENQVLKLSYSKLLKSKNTSPGSKVGSQSKLLSAVQQELDQKKLLCENLAQKASFYKGKYKSLKNSMLSQALNNYTMSPSNENDFSHEKMPRPIKAEHDSIHKHTFGQKQLFIQSQALHSDSEKRLPNLVTLPSISSDVSQEEYSMTLKNFVPEFPDFVAGMLPTTQLPAVPQPSHLVTSRTPSTSLADEEQLQAKQKCWITDSHKISTNNYVPDQSLGKRAPQWSSQNLLTTITTPEVIQSQGVVFEQSRNENQLQTATTESRQLDHFDDEMDGSEPETPAFVSIQQVSNQPSEIVPAETVCNLMHEEPLPSQAIKCLEKTESFDPLHVCRPVNDELPFSNLLDDEKAEHTAPIEKAETTIQDLGQVEPEAQGEQATHKTSPISSGAKDAKPKRAVKISYGTSDEDEESSLQSEDLEQPQREQHANKSNLSNKVLAGYKTPGLSMFGVQTPTDTLLSMLTGPSPQVSSAVAVAKLSKPAFLSGETNPETAPGATTDNNNTWPALYSCIWKFVEKLSTASPLESETRDEFLKMLNLFREIASKSLDSKGNLAVGGGASPLEMLLQPAVKERQYSVKQVLGFQPEVKPASSSDCQQFVIQTVAFLVFISYFQECPVVQQAVQQSGVLSPGLIADPLLQSKFAKVQEIVTSSQRRNSTSSNKNPANHFGLLRVAFEHLVFVCERQTVPFSTQDLFMSNLFAQKANFNELRDAGHYAAEKASRAGLKVPFCTDLEDLLAATRLLFHTMKHLGTGFQRSIHQILRGFFSNRKYRNTAQQLVACLLLRQAAHANF